MYEITKTEHDAIYALRQIVATYITMTNSPIIEQIGWYLNNIINEFE